MTSRFPPAPAGPHVTLTINDEVRSVRRNPDRSLLTLLRDELALTGTKYGCGEGECGACTVLLDGRPARACQVRVSEAADARVVTIEGLSRDGTLTPVQRAFAELGAFQCGFCTPGMVVRATALLRSHPHPSRRDIAAEMDGNLCRCGGYSRILRAIEAAADRTARDSRGDP